MGRIKTALIKRITFDVYKRHRDQLKEDFQGNKQVVSQLVDIPSKKLRNVVAGYLTRLVKAKKEL